MSSNFDWRAEDDISWDKYAAPEADEGQPGPKRKRPIWLIALVVLVVLLSAGYLAYRQVRRYVDNTAASVEEDVLSSHALVKMAAQEGDLELFAPLLSGRDPNWTQDQLAILDMNLLFQRQPFGLSWRPQETSDDISVSLSSDLQSAEIEYQESYGYGLNGEEGIVQLTQTAVYRLSETRWLLSPPDDDFWGSYITAKGNYIELTFPDRDDETGSQLASDLEAVLSGACQRLELDCDESQPLDVLLATDLDAMMDTSDPELFAQAGDQLVLPTPTLVGKPANNASYRALYRGYATIIVSHLIARQAEWECCDQSPFFKALLDAQLHQLGLQTWPLTLADYRLALRRPLKVDTLREIRAEELSLAEFQERPDWPLTYLFVEFLINQEDAPPIIELQRTMARTASFGAWTAQAGVTGDDAVQEPAWQAAVQQRILDQQGPPPVNWPEEDIALICNDGQTGISNVYRYDLSQSSWKVELANRDFVVMNGLPNNEGLILTEQFLDVDQLRTTLWRDGQETVVIFGDAFYFSTERSNPDGTQLVLNSFEQETFTSEYNLLDIENCDDESCPLSRIEGLPVWSPDGSRTLWVMSERAAPIVGEWPLFLGDGRLQSPKPIGDGNSPFWLDNENYAFLQGGPQDVALVMASVNDNAPQILLTQADLAALVPDLEETEIRLNDATTDPTAPNLIYITAVNRLENIDYLFTLEWQRGEIELVLETENSPGGLLVPRFSPDNHWLVLRTNFSVASSSSQRQQNIYLYNTESQTTLLYTMSGAAFLPGRSWSNNGDWLASLSDGFIMLSAPDANYDHLVRHEFQDCTDMAWIKGR